MEHPNVSAVILAAGFSRRMGFFKPLAELNGTTAIERSITSAKAAGISEIAVVTGFKRETLEPVILRNGAKPVFNSRFPEGMYSSIQAGAASLSPASRAFLILPADCAAVRPSTIRLLAARASYRGIIHPVFLGERGHPPVIGASFIPHILTFEGEGGLRSFLETRESSAADLPVADEGILMDMDTPEDLLQIRRKLNSLSIPSEREVRALFGIAGTPEKVIAHSRMVSEAAEALANGASGKLHFSISLVTAAALLHDVCRTMEDHHTAAEAFLKSWGFAAIARIAAVHMDLPPRTSPGAAIVFLADKMVMGDRIVSLSERKKRALEKYGRNPEARANIRRRFARARRVCHMIERASGSTVQSLLDLAGHLDA